MACVLVIAAIKYQKQLRDEFSLMIPEGEAIVHESGQLEQESERPHLQLQT